MSESTDTTAVLPVIDQNQTSDSEQTVTLPVVPLAASPQAIVQPAFEPDRARALHAHRVLQRILATPHLPIPSTWEGHAYSSPMLDLILLDGGAEALTAYQRVFGGQLTTETVAAHESPAGFPVPEQEYARLATVMEGIDVLVSCWTPVPPAPEPPVAEAPTVPVEPEAAPAVEEAPVADAPAETAAAQ